MNEDLKKAFIFGYERISSWSYLLDNINVFPIQDSDTGSNLKISLTPLRQFDGNIEKTKKQLLISATGNSGNIAASFFYEFLNVDINNIKIALKAGRNRAFKSVANPKQGTILTIFDELLNFLEVKPFSKNIDFINSIIKHLENTVFLTNELLPELKEAGVVDSGALAMFIFFEVFFLNISGHKLHLRPVIEVFKDKLNILTDLTPKDNPKYCINTLVKSDKIDESELLSYGDSVVINRDDKNAYYKLHLHADDPSAVKSKIESIGQIELWSNDYLLNQKPSFPYKKNNYVHIMTDAAGSITRSQATILGITLLDSYLIIGDLCIPETHYSYDKLYDAMKKDIKVSTAQASIFERHQCYQSVLAQNKHVIYLCVGSVFTGNYDVVNTWKKENDHEDRLIVIDTEAASGKLSAIVFETAIYAERNKDINEIVDFAKQAVKECQEYVFIDKLKYLVKGGRLSKSSGFFGDLFNIKPVISPTAQGAKKVGIARNKDEQLDFALKKLKENLKNNSDAFILIEYSDNFEWIDNVIKKEIKNCYPSAKIILQPISLTSGAHFGPSAWAVAFLNIKILP